MSVRLNDGRRKSQLRVTHSGGAGTATVLPSSVGCVLGPEAEACFNGRTTITLQEYLKGSAPA